jgi:multidrug efflux pump
MRIWLDPNKLNSYQLTTADVTSAITAQNAQVSAGQLGGLPAKPGQQLNATIVAQTRLSSAEQFGKILLKVNADGSRVLLKNVARIELGAETYRTKALFNGKPATGVAIKLASGANALDTAQAVRNKVTELSAYFPKGVKAVYPYDTTPS